MRLDRPHLLDYLCTVELILVDFIDYALNHTLHSAFSNGQLVISLFNTFCIFNSNDKNDFLSDQNEYMQDFQKNKYTDD